MLRYPTTFTTQAPPAFARDEPSGRVDLSRDGNIVVAQTQGVRRYTLLLSPAQFNFSEPIRVVTNGGPRPTRTTRCCLEPSLRSRSSVRNGWAWTSMR